MRRLPLLFAIVLAFGLAACDEAPTTTTPTSDPTKDIFSDVLEPNGARTHPFTTARSGDVIATLTALDPDATVVIGVALGTLSGSGTCQILLSRDAATVNSVVTGAVTSATSLCLRVYDAAGALTAPTTYTVQVLHP